MRGADYPEVMFQFPITSIW